MNIIPVSECHERVTLKSVDIVLISGCFQICHELGNFNGDKCISRIYHRGACDVDGLDGLRYDVPDWLKTLAENFPESEELPSIDSFIAETIKSIEIRIGYSKIIVNPAYFTYLKGEITEYQRMGPLSVELTPDMSVKNAPFKWDSSVDIEDRLVSILSYIPPYALGFE